MNTRSSREGKHSYGWLGDTVIEWGAGARGIVISRGQFFRAYRVGPGSSRSVDPRSMEAVRFNGRQ